MEDLKALILWAENEIKHMRYGELTITVKLHDGRVSLIETSKTERNIPEVQS